MNPSKADMISLANYIAEAIAEEFAQVRLTGNLVETIEITPTDKGVAITIPAEAYETYYWFVYRAIVPNGKGSYASKLDTEGSAFMVYDPMTGNPVKYVTPRNHKGYLKRSIDKGIERWMEANRGRFESRRKDG